MHNSEQPFMLKNSSTNFQERQKNIFDQLNSLKCDLRKDEEMEVDKRIPTKKRDRKVTKQFRGKESIFKVPQAPVIFMKTIPDFKKNPHKWTKYSLADVKDEDMSDSSNTNAALSFLRELKKTRADDNIDTSEAPKKIIFNKVESSSVKGSRSKDDPEAKPSFRSSKVVMPEYVVGQKIKKEKKKKDRIVGSSQLKLDHLYEDD